MAYGQETPPTAPAQVDPDLAQLYVIDAASLEAEAILDTELGTPPIWVSDSEFVYYDRQSGWNVVPIDGSGLRTIPAPLPSNGWAVRVDDSTVAYIAVFGQRDAVALDAKLITIDVEAGTVTELAPPTDLNPEGHFPDPGYLLARTSDLRYAVLGAFAVANEFNQGPTTYVYDVENRELIPQPLPGTGHKRAATNPSSSDNPESPIHRYRIRYPMRPTST